MNTEIKQIGNSVFTYKVKGQVKHSTYNIGKNHEAVGHSESFTLGRKAKEYETRTKLKKAFSYLWEMRLQILVFGVLLSSSAISSVNGCISSQECHGGVFFILSEFLQAGIAVSSVGLFLSMVWYKAQMDF